MWHSRCAHCPHKKECQAKKDEVDSVDKEKKAGVSDASRKLAKGDSPNSVVKPKTDDKPKKDKVDAVDEEKKAGGSGPSRKLNKGG